jgi:hypothetical protein
MNEFSEKKLKNNPEGYDDRIATVYSLITGVCSLDLSSSLSSSSSSSPPPPPPSSSSASLSPSSSSQSLF